ncbi:hypothetical protein [Nonomuraea sp. NPDC023979]|uniref:hypothetical protein n=1 Tax=Nonomuraea sp. NPDC023979 TaxID=3154796 RepID=UPI0033FA1E8D
MYLCKMMLPQLPEPLATMMQMGMLAGRLTELLRVRFVPGDPTYHGPISKGIEQIGLYLNGGETLKARLEAIRLMALVSDLEVIERERPDIFELLRIKLVNPQSTNYFGTRCEVAVAQWLISRVPDIPFSYDLPGHSDFSFAHTGIECTSAVLGTRSTTLPGNKIRRRIRAKKSEPYCQPSIALVLDVTGLQQTHYEGEEGIIGVDQAQPHVLSAMKEASFGSVVIISMVADPATEVIRRVHARFDSDNATPQLIELLDQVYHKGPEMVYEGLWGLNKP